MISVIMPFYKKFIEFKFAFEKGNLETFNSIQDMELLICVDAPLEADLLIKYLTQLVQLKTLNFSVKVIYNAQDHPWRCPSAAINVGIRHAKNEKLLVISPETLAFQQSILTLTQACNETHFSIGIIKFASYEKIKIWGPEHVLTNLPSPFLPYGSICFTKNQAEIIGGYDESFQIWGGDDDDFRMRLQWAGFTKTPTLARFLHHKFEDREINRAGNLKTEKSEKKIAEKIHYIKQKTSFMANQGVYGNSFSKIIFQFIHEQPQLELIKS